MLIRGIRSEAWKGRHSLFFPVQLLLPLLAIGALKLYYEIGHAFTASFRLSVAVTLLAAAFPVGIAWMTAVSVGREEESRFQRLLTAPSRAGVLAGKLLVLYGMGVLAAGTAVSGLYLPVPELSAAGGVLLFTAFAAVGAILYPLHMFLNLRFGKTCSLLAAFAGGVLGLLLLTGIGDACWQWLPYSALARLVRYVGALYCGELSEQERLIYGMEIRKAAPALLLWLSVCIPAVFIWFRRWEGRSVME